MSILVATFFDVSLAFAMMTPFWVMVLFWFSLIGAHNHHSPRVWLPYLLRMVAGIYVFLFIIIALRRMGGLP